MVTRAGYTGSAVLGLGLRSANDPTLIARIVGLAVHGRTWRPTSLLHSSVETDRDHNLPVVESLLVVTNPRPTTETSRRSCGLWNAARSRLVAKD